MDEKWLARASWGRSLEIKPDNNESKGWLILSSPGIVDFSFTLLFI